MTPTLRFILAAAALVGLSALAAAAAGRVPAEALGWAGFLGLAGAAVALAWGVAAMRAARRRLRPAPQDAHPSAPLNAPGEGAPGGVTIALVPGTGEGAHIVHDSSGASTAPPPLGPPGEAERQAAAIIRQIERASGPARRSPRPSAGTDVPPPTER